MSQETDSIECEQSQSADAGSDECRKSQSSAIDRLFQKMQQIQAEKTEAACQTSQSEENEPKIQDPSVINRLFEKVTYNRLDALPKPEVQNSITRITRTEIKAMKTVATTAESKPDVVVRKQCASTVHNFWSDLTNFICSFSEPKSK